MKNEELKRIDKNINGEQPKGPKILITARNVNNPEEVLNNTKTVMKVISKYAYTNSWPSNEEWKEILPKSFVESMTLKTTEDRDKDENLWHFESWVDNIRQRFWVWWSSKMEKNSVSFVFEAISIPYLYDSFIYILYSQGISIENIIVEDDVY